MRVYIITTGNEILDGRILDTNSHYIHKQIQHFPLHVVKSAIVPDAIDLIVKEIKSAYEDSDICFISGGLGPTDDDRTVEAVSRAVSLPLVRNEREVEKLELKLKPKGLPLNDNNLKQAFLPKTSTALDNPMGTAPGFYLIVEKTHIFCLPGVPSELKYIFENHIIPLLESLTGGRINSQRQHSIKTMGISEARMSEIVSTSEVLKNYTWGMTANHDGICTAITLKNRHEPQKEIELINDYFTSLIGHYVYGYNDDTLPEIVQAIALEKKVSLAVAESCTGGLVGQLITDVAGSSGYFKGGIIAYSNDIKIELLKVKEETIEAHGAVSNECAEEMAEGALRLFNSDYAVSITGIAGPGGGTKGKPVGTVCFALADKQGRIDSYRRVFFGTRDDVRKKGAYNALNYVRLFMITHETKVSLSSGPEPE